MVLLSRSQVRWEPLLLVGVMWLSVTGAVVAAGWTEGLWTLWPLVLGGWLLGMVLGLLRPVPSLFAHAFAAVSAAVWAASAVVLAPSLADNRAGLDLLADLLRRLPAILAANRAGMAYPDNALFVLQLGLLGCLLVYLSVWQTLRHGQVWPGVLLAGGALGLTLAYAPASLQPYFIPYLLAAGLLLVYQQTHVQERHWRGLGSPVASDLALALRRHGVALVVVGVVAGWAIPLTPVQPGAYADLRTRLDATLHRFLPGLTYPASGASLISNALPLSAGIEADPQPVFEVRTQGALTPTHWRAMVYDQYTGHGWINTNTTVSAIAAGDGRLMADPWQARTVITQTLTLLQPGGSAVYSAGQPLALSLAGQAQVGRMETVRLVGGETVTLLDVAQLSATRAWESGDTLLLLSALSTATPDQLRQAGTRYPRWVTERYLQLPDSTPTRVQERARSLTTGAATPYDQALALETYLRTFPYQRTIPTPPAGEDLVDWFLFDLRTGYCTYYASAFVVMARSLGLPARLVVGYAQGQSLPEQGVRRFRESDAHAWPEVFFPQYGWIEFEPTAALPPSQGDDSALPTTDPVPADAEVVPDSSFPSSDPLANDDLTPGHRTAASLASLPIGTGGGWAGLSMVMVALGASGLGSALYWGRWMKGLWGLSRVERAWEQAVRLGMLLEARLDPAQTPHEMASALARVMPEAQGDIDSLVAGYVRQRFSPCPLPAADLAALEEASARLRRVGLRRWLARRLP